MKDESFTLDGCDRPPLPPFAYGYTVTGSGKAFWTVRDAAGRAAAKATTRAGARAAILALYRQCGRIAGAAPLDREALREIDRAAREEALRPRRWTPTIQAPAQQLRAG